MFNTTLDESAPAVELRVQKDLLSWVSDANLALAAPIVAYWTFSMFFNIIDVKQWFSKYRLHTPNELESMNRCTMWEVIRAVILQHVVQTLAGLVLALMEPPQMTGYEDLDLWKLQKNLHLPYSAAWIIYYIIAPGVRIFLGCVIMDTWQYTLHRTMHMNKWLYRNFHSVHHRLYVPYAFGALYNSLIEGLLLDTCGAGLSYALTGMSTRESIVFYTFSTMKTVDDHCGYQLPWDPFQLLFPNNAAFHDIHHQQFGIKTNFSQPFFVHWDNILGTKFKGTKQYIEKNRLLREQQFAEEAVRKQQ